MERTEHWRAYWVGGFTLGGSSALIAALGDPPIGLSAAVLAVPTLFLIAGFLHQLMHLYALTLQSLAVLLQILLFSVMAGLWVSPIIADDALLGWLVAIPLFLFLAQPVLYVWGRLRCRPLKRQIKQSVQQLRRNAVDAEQIHNASQGLASSVREGEAINRGALEQRKHLEDEIRSVCLLSGDPRTTIVGKELREKDYQQLTLQDLKTQRNRIRRKRGPNSDPLNALLIEKALLDRETHGAYARLSGMRAQLGCLQNDLRRLSSDRNRLERQERDHQEALRAFCSQKIPLD